MADFKTYTIGFEAADRFSGKFNEILAKLDKLTNMVHKIDIGVDSGAISRIEASTDRVTRAVKKSTTEFGSQKRALDQASAGFRNLADSMDRAAGSHGRFGGILDALKGKFSGLLDVADDFSNMTRSLAQGDVLGAARSGSSMMSGAGRGLAAGLGISTGALLVGGSVAAAAALSVPAAATWEKQVGRASKTALDDSAGYTKGDLSAGMLSTLMDVKGINQQDLIDAVGRAGSLGYTNEEAIQAATVGSKAGAAFEIETGEAMRMLGVVNQMWAEQSELVGGNIVMMEKAGSAVNVLGNKYASTESNILQFLSEAGGLAKTWNMDVAETAAIGSLLETVNIKASEGETMFRSALNAGIFQKRALTEDQAKAFKKAGVRPRGEMGYDIAGSMLGVSGKEYQEMLNTNMADTMLATVDAVLEKSGGDNSLAQQMAEAAFGSYGMGFLKLGGQRGNLAEMTAEARKGFDAGNSMEEEYQRQTANLIDTFGQTKEIFSAIAKVLGGFLLPPLALLLSVFNGLLGPVAKLAIFLQNILFKQIDKLIGKFMGTNLGQDIGKAITATTEAAGKIWEVIGPIIVKLLEGLLDIMSGPMMAVLWLIAAIYDKIRPYVLQLVEGILGILDKLKGMWNWLMDAIPGARKEEARIALERQAKKEGLAITPAGSIVHADRFGAPIATSGAAGEASETLLGLQAKYLALPGFAEGIADAVRAGLSGLGDIIGKAVGENMPDFPTFDDLVKTLEDLAAAIESIPGLGSWDEVAGSRITSAETGAEYYAEVNSESGERRIRRHRPWYKGGADDLIEDESDLPADVKDALTQGHASGLTFTGTGTYFGKFHGPEEVLSQASTIRGPGIIARAMEALDGVTRGSGQAGRGGETHIHVENKNRFEFAGARFSPDFDMEAFLKMIDARIETGSVEAAKKVIGNRRT